MSSKTSRWRTAKFQHSSRELLATLMAVLRLIHIMTREIRLFGSRGYNWYLDMVEDGIVDELDLIHFMGVIGTIQGDANLDGKVNSAGMNIMGPNLHQPGDFGWADGDFDGDGDVDNSGLNELRSNLQWGT